MKPYPSIPHAFQLSEITKGLTSSSKLYIFDKLDGSNIRVEWDKKQGFYKFGTRHQLLNPNDPVFGLIPNLFKETMAPQLEPILKEQKYDNATCFFEYYGPNSFGGFHNDNDVKKLSLLDVSPYKVGILNPTDFMRIFGKLDLPALIWEGFYSPQLIKDMYYQVVNGELPGVTFEGIIGKVDSGSKVPPTMFKLKSQAWLDRLKTKCGNNTILYEQLK